MTDRLKGCVVAFESDIRDDDAEPILEAIKMLRGVAGVTFNITDPDDWINRQQVKTEIRSKFYELFKAL